MVGMALNPSFNSTEIFIPQQADDHVDFPEMGSKETSLNTPLKLRNEGAKRFSLDWEFMQQLKFDDDFIEGHRILERRRGSTPRTPEAVRKITAKLESLVGSDDDDDPFAENPKSPNKAKVDKKVEMKAWSSDEEELENEIPATPPEKVEIQIQDLVPAHQNRDKYRLLHRENEGLWAKYKFYFLVVAVVGYTFLGAFFYMENEKWTLLEALYFMAVFMSTVGYGDVHPTNTEARVFTLFYGLIGLVIFAYVVGMKLKAVYIKDRLAARRAQVIGIHVCMGHHVGMQNREFWDLIVRAILPLCALILACVIFCVQELEYEVIEGFYFALCTVSTVGLGDISPGVKKNGENSTLGKYFAIAFIVLFLAANLNFHGETWLYRVNANYRKEFEAMLTKNLPDRVLKSMDVDAEDPHTKIDPAHWITGILVHNNIIAPHVAHQMFRRFEELDAEKKGYLTIQQVRDCYSNTGALLDVQGKVTLWERVQQKASSFYAFLSGLVHANASLLQGSFRANSLNQPDKRYASTTQLTALGSGDQPPHNYLDDEENFPL